MGKKRIFHLICILSMVFLFTNNTFAEDNDIVWGVKAGDSFEWIVKTLDWHTEDEDKEADYQLLPYKQKDIIKIDIQYNLPLKYDDDYVGNYSYYYAVYINEEEIEYEELKLQPIFVPLTIEKAGIGEDYFDMLEDSLIGETLPSGIIRTVENGNKFFKVKTEIEFSHGSESVKQSIHFTYEKTRGMLVYFFDNSEYKDGEDILEYFKFELKEKSGLLLSFNWFYAVFALILISLGPIIFKRNKL